MIYRICSILMLTGLVVSVFVHGGNHLKVEIPGTAPAVGPPSSTPSGKNAAVIERLYIFSLNIDDITVNISEGQVYRDDLAKLYERFSEEGNIIKSGIHWKKQIQDIVIWEANKYDQISVKADVNLEDYIPISLGVTFSPIPEGDLLAVVSHMTIYIEDTPVYQSRGKAYLTAPYPPYGSPFLYSVKAAFNEFAPGPLIDRLEKYRYFVPVLVLDENRFSPTTNKNPLMESILQRVDEVKAFLEKEFNVKLDKTIKNFKKDVEASTRKIIFSAVSKTVTKEYMDKLRKNDREVNAYIFKLQQGECLVLDSGAGRDSSINKVIFKLPDGEEAEFNVAYNCNKYSKRAIWVKCIKNKNGTYIVKEDNRELLTTIKVMGLEALRNIYKGRVIAR
jgi:hypothetical protein